MNCVERATVFGCSDETLVGIVSAPSRPRSIGVVIIVGGPQYRAGSHRQFVLLARALSAGGYACLRFDYRGMGDSSGELRQFDAVNDDVAAAIAALRREAPSVEKVVLWGLCDGASAALLYWQATRDATVEGMCLANPWVRSQEGQARTQVKHYYLQRLRERAFWVKLLSGRVATSALSGLLGNVRLALKGSQRHTNAQARFQERMADAWQRFPGRILLLLSGQDYTAKEFMDAVEREAAWQGALQRPNVERVDLAEADHTFSRPADCQRAQQLSVDWLGRLIPT